MSRAKLLKIKNMIFGRKSEKNKKEKEKSKESEKETAEAGALAA